MKLNQFLVIVLSTAAFAYGTLSDSVSTTALAQNRTRHSPATSQQSSPLDKQPNSAPLAAGVGIITLFALLATVIVSNNRRSRSSKPASKIDRFQEEFACSPLAEWYRSKLEGDYSSPTAQSTTSEIAPSPTAEETPLTPSDENVISPIHEEISVEVEAQESSNPITDSPSHREQYLGLIDQIIEIIIKGQIRSKEQVYQMLVQTISSGTGEIFERCFAERKNVTQYKLDNIQESQRLFPEHTAQLKKAQQTRILKALQIIEGEWERWQKENRAADAIAKATGHILSTKAGERFTTLLQVLDPNQNNIFTLSQIQQLGKSLQNLVESCPEPEQDQEIKQLASGISQGLASWQQLEGYLVSWMYEGNSSQLGIGAAPKQREPWASWAKQVSSPLPQQLFLALAYNQSASPFVSQQSHADLKAWVELAVLLGCVQRGLVSWFEKQPYSSKWGTASSISTFLTFAIIWCQLSNGCSSCASRLNGSVRQQLDKACFQMMLQILRAFAQRAYFPLYGGVFASFSGEYLQHTLNYLSEPLKQVEGTQEKARILTLLGYSQRVLGQYERANSFHQEALEIARQAGDQPCEIANLNHQSRICVAQKNYTEAIHYSQRALILSRSVGDRLGEANALTNLGYSEVKKAQQLEEMEPTVYETAIEYLKQGFQLSGKLDASLWDSFASRQSQALACNSLGLAHIALQQPQAAIEYLEKGIEAAKFSGDLYLQGLNFTYLSEAYYSLQNLEKAIYTGGISMYLLKQMSCQEWRQSAGLLTILQGQLGAESFQNLLKQQRDEIVKNIGVDGYDYLPQLLEQYKCST